MTVNYQRWLRSYVGHHRILQLSASAFITNDEGQVLLGRRTDVMLWAPPSGVLQLGETPAQTIEREVLEETGLHVHAEHLIGLYTGPEFEWTYSNGDQSQIISAFFRCEVLGGELKPDDAEFVSLGYYSPNALPTLMPRYVRMIADAFAHLPAAKFD